jgi:hypothetical protein
VDINDSTNVTIPLRNLIAIGMGLCLFLGQWFVLDSRVDKLENEVVRLVERDTKNTEFRWLQVPQDTEQTVRLNHIEEALTQIDDCTE